MNPTVTPLLAFLILFSLFTSCKSEFDDSSVLKDTRSRGGLLGLGAMSTLLETDTVYGYVRLTARSRMNRPQLAGTPYYCDLDGYFANYDLEGENYLQRELVPAGAFTLGDSAILPNLDPGPHYIYRSSEYLLSLFGNSVLVTLQGDSIHYVPSYSFSMDLPELLECEIDTASKSYGLELSWNAAGGNTPIMIEVSDSYYDTSWSTFTDDDGFYKIEPSALGLFQSGNHCMYR